MKNNFKGSKLLVIVVLIIGAIIGFLSVSPILKADEIEQKSIYTHNIFADIASKVDNGVVKVTSIIEVNSESTINPFFNDPFFEYFFGEHFNIPEQGPKTQEGYGSGFIVTSNGFILTNEHVIHNAKQVEVTIKGIEESLAAEVVWSDFNLDLAILKVDVNNELEPIELGDSSNINPGDWAIAIGNPFGFEHTVTTGVISALGRPIQIPGNDGSRDYQNLIQTDAAINPGNSGGPLLNLDGKVIGINTAVSVQGQGIGFAIPINEAKDIVDDLKTKGEIIRPWLGISFGPITENIKEYFNLDNTEGVIISEIFEGSSADKANLKTYDIIKEIDEQKIINVEDVLNIISNKEIGDKIMIRVIRNGQSKFIFAIIGKKPAQM
jgi:serine protease Do